MLNAKEKILVLIEKKILVFYNEFVKILKLNFVIGIYNAPFTIIVGQTKLKLSLELNYGFASLA
jgi:hypothetical protein